MQVVETEIPAVKRVVPRRFGDERGWFSETFRADILAQAGIDNAFVQDNQSFSAPAGTVRGLHFQVAPMAQAKLVRVLAGSILDVAVDLRRGSPTFGRHVAVRLDAQGGEQLFVPPGFAHGFCTLEPDTMVAYKVDAYYSPEHDRSLLWNDPEIGIAWPVDANSAILSGKDKIAPRLAELPSAF
ncbi:dTDP-4-dehydrorhamnose 3,5-epimerase [Methylobacterium nigriterrae]|uniref:dTDP-4-dehydrorhamnose 3,5-epimerase n=1 Tax=Methylobacterium nigriterrae TaxID=3127512 RepID=UPI003013423F